LNGYEKIWNSINLVWRLLTNLEPRSALIKRRWRKNVVCFQRKGEEVKNRSGCSHRGVAYLKLSRGGRKERGPKQRKEGRPKSGKKRGDRAGVTILTHIGGQIVHIQGKNSRFD